MTETTGQRIKRLREERRWSQRTLGDLLGVTSKTISNWERDQHIPRASIGALEKAFRQPLESADPVESAVRNSELTEDRQTTVLGFYQRLLREQREGKVS